MVILFCLLRGCPVFGGSIRVRISKVEGHADEALVRAGGARDLDRLGHIGADEAADFGRRRVPWWVIDARRNFSGVCARWRPVVLGLHRFCIAVARAVVNHDGVAGTAFDPVVWSVGGALKKRRVVHAVRDRDFLPRPAGIWDGEWGVVVATHVTCYDAELWPYSISKLVKWVAFLYSLHWPQGGVVSLMLSCSSFCELWSAERLSLEKAHPRYLRPGRPISVPAVPFGPGIDIWRSCRFIGAIMRSLCLLPGRLGSPVPLVLITVGFGTLGGESVVMALLPGLVSRPRKVF